MTLEKRRSVRISSQFPVRYIIFPTKAEWSEGFSRDVGEGGISFITQHELLPGAPLNLEVELPRQGIRLKTRGIIAWQNRIKAKNWCYYKAGLQFQEIDWPAKCLHR